MLTFRQAANRFFRLTPSERRAVLAQTGVPLDPAAGDDLHPFIDAVLLLRQLGLQATFLRAMEAREHETALGEN